MSELLEMNICEDELDCTVHYYADTVRIGNQFFPIYLVEISRTFEEEPFLQIRANEDTYLPTALQNISTHTFDVLVDYYSKEFILNEFPVMLCEYVRDHREPLGEYQNSKGQCIFAADMHIHLS